MALITREIEKQVLIDIKGLKEDATDAIKEELRELAEKIKKYFYDYHEDVIKEEIYRNPKVKTFRMLFPIDIWFAILKLSSPKFEILREMVGDQFCNNFITVTLVRDDAFLFVNYLRIELKY